MDLLAKVEQATQIIHDAISVYKPSHVFALFSGGHDSVTASHLAFHTRVVNSAVHINTGIGIGLTRSYVETRCREFGWPLLEYKAIENRLADGTPDPQIYRDIVLEHGFPGPPQHKTMYARLKERQIARLVREHKRFYKDKIMLITGVRQEESIRRMGHVKRVQVDKARVWVAPLIEFTKYDVREYMRLHSIPRNPVVDEIGFSGECLCGSFAQQGELKRICSTYAEEGAKIEKLQAEVLDAGFPWGWEDGPPEWWTRYKAGQDFLDEEMFMPLCMDCPTRRAAMNSKRRSA